MGISEENAVFYVMSGITLITLIVCITVLIYKGKLSVKRDPLDGFWSVQPPTWESKTTVSGTPQQVAEYKKIETDG